MGRKPAGSLFSQVAVVGSDHVDVLVGVQQPTAAAWPSGSARPTVRGARCGASRRTGSPGPPTMRAARAVELAYFGGMTHDEIASALEVSVPTVERDLRIARAWLKRELSDEARR